MTRSLPQCPVCTLTIEIDEFDVDPGATISCPECGVSLQVLHLSPIILEHVPDQEIGDW